VLASQPYAFQIMLYWITVLFLTVLFAKPVAEKIAPTMACARKTFHVSAVLLFAPVAWLCHGSGPAAVTADAVLVLGSGVALCLMFILEILR